jgi:alpha/beta superfamily hydrolase
MAGEIAVGPPRKLWIEGPAGRLEAVLRAARPARAAAVVSHPHPLHGGTLHNPVVFHSDRELNRAGFSTLRFNVRGVGASSGAHDEGRGEVDDLACAADWLRGAAPGAALILVGYSFGAWCSVRLAARDPRVAAVVAIGLPTRHYPCDDLARLGRPVAVVQGDADELGPIAEVRSLLAGQAEGRLYVVERGGHLFPDRASGVAALVVEAALAILGVLERP